MLGFRGASRYYDPRYVDSFALECAALLRARKELGLINIKIMIPFVRTVAEAERVMALPQKSAVELGRGQYHPR